MTYTYRTKGTCSQQITFDLEDGVVKNIEFLGGCNGNLKAISKLVDGMNAVEIISKLKGNTCGFRTTSCADQLALAIETAMENK